MPAAAALATTTVVVAVLTMLVATVVPPEVGLGIITTRSPTLKSLELATENSRSCGLSTLAVRLVDMYAAEESIDDWLMINAKSFAIHWGVPGLLSRTAVSTLLVITSSPAKKET